MNQPKNRHRERPPLSTKVTKDNPAESDRWWPVHPAIKGSAAPMPRKTGKTVVPQIQLEENDDE